MSLISIKTATYGVPGQEKDVSFTIQCMRGVGACFTNAEIPVNNSSMGCDPAPGAMKRLRVVYRVGFNETVVETPEGQVMHIPARQ